MPARCCDQRLHMFEQAACASLTNSEHSASLDLLGRPPDHTMIMPVAAGASSVQEQPIWHMPEHDNLQIIMAIRIGLSTSIIFAY